MSEKQTTPLGPVADNEWPKFAAWLLAIQAKEVCGKQEDFVFGDWHDACKLAYEHDGPHDFEVKP